jgi:hypothetical protein
MNPKAINLFGAVMTLVALILAWQWFDWKLALVIFLALWGHGMERYKK